MDLFSHLKKHLDTKEVDELEKALLKQESVNSLFLNTKVISNEEFKKRYPKVIPHSFMKNTYYYPSEYDLGRNFLFDVGAYYIQDASASLVSHFLDAQENDRVLDMCASPGGKSINVALNMKNRGLLVSNDINHARALVLSQNIERFGLINVLVSNNDLLDFINDYENYFDKVILDAPCSGSGMIRKEPKMLDDWSENKVKKLSVIQMKLLQNAVKFCKPLGIIVYSTCSFSYEENEEVILEILKEGNVELIKIPPFEGSYTHQDLPGSLRLHPNHFKGEGHFICLLRKIQNRFLHPQYKSQKSIKNNFPYETNFEFSQIPYFINYHDKIFGTSFNDDLKFFNIIRSGMEIGTKEKFGFVYHHAISHYLKAGIDIDFEMAQKYLRGEEIELRLDDGYYLLKYENFPFAITRVKNNIGKNLYPKGLRRNNLII